MDYKKLLFFACLSLTLICASLTTYNQAAAGTCECLCYHRAGSCGYSGFNTVVESCFISKPNQAACESASCSATKSVVYGCMWTY